MAMVTFPFPLVTSEFMSTTRSTSNIVFQGRLVTLSDLKLLPTWLQFEFVQTERLQCSRLGAFSVGTPLGFEHGLYHSNNTWDTLVNLNLA